MAQAKRYFKVFQMLVWRAFFISDFAPWKPNEPADENTRRKSVCICMPLQREILGIQDWTNLICLRNGVWERVAKIRIIKTKYFVLIDTHNRNVSNSCAYTLEQNMVGANGLEPGRKVFLKKNSLFEFSKSPVFMRLLLLVCKRTLLPLVGESVL